MWRLTPGQGLRAQQFGEEVVLFNDRTGATHLLGMAALELLTLLRGGPASSAALGAALAARLDTACDPQFIEETTSLLADLARLDLVGQLPC